MARIFTPQDCHVIMNSLVKEATGREPTIKATDTSSFASCGETVIATGTENTMNALSRVLARTVIASRPHSAKFAGLRAANSGAYSERMRKISFYTDDAVAAGNWNTQLFGENLKRGNDNTGSSTATKSMYEQIPAVPLEVNFGGSDVWDVGLTIYEDQLKVAFADEASFGSFVAGMLQQKRNEIELQKEAFSRMTVLNYIAGAYDLKDNMPGTIVNLTEKFNTEFGTTYTSAELRTTHIQQFMEFFVKEYKLASEYLTELAANFHWQPEKEGFSLLRETPVNKQRAMLYSPLMKTAETLVKTEIFNDNYLSLDRYEPILYWQNRNEPSKISITPAIPNVADPSEQTAGTAVTLDYVVGMIYDVDAMMIDFQMDSAAVSPLEARKNYRTMWWHFRRLPINDFTENAVIFIMKDPDPGKKK